MESMDIIRGAPHSSHCDADDRENTIPPTRSAKSPVLLETTWGLERLLPFNCSVKWPDYSGYLSEYYNRNVPEFLNRAAANQNPELLLDPATGAGKFDATNGTAAAKFCIKMEEELVSEWKIQVAPSPDKMLPVNTIIQSSLIQDRARSSICAEGEEFPVASTIAFVCIANEADLMRELLRRGAVPTDDIIEQSTVIRMCALSLSYLKGCQSVPAAAAMVGIAKEAQKMCDWVKKENRLVTFSLSTPHELEESRLIRIRTLDVMITLVESSLFSSSEMQMEDDEMAEM